MIHRSPNSNEIILTSGGQGCIDRSSVPSSLSGRPRMIGTLEEDADAVRGERAKTVGLVGAATTRTQQRSTAAFGLLAARVVASLRRISLGKTPDEVDKHVLSSASDYLQKEAEVLTYVEGNREAAFSVTHIRSAGLAAAVLRSVATAKNESTQSDSTAVVDLARDVNDLLVNPRPDEARRLETVFKAMASTARVVTGATGDRVVRGRPGSHSKRG